MIVLQPPKSLCTGGWYVAGERRLAKPVESVDFKPFLDTMLSGNGASLRNSHERLIQASKMTVGTFVLLGLVTMLCVPNHEYLLPLERHAAGTAFVVQLLANIARFTPHFYYFKGNGNERPFYENGVTMVAMTVQTVAMLTNFTLAACPTPVLIDPHLGSRIYMFRWCEWMPLVALMTFLAEELERPGHAMGRWHALAQFVSTASGAIFPYCTNLSVWLIVGVVAVVLFLLLYVRIYQKHQAIQHAQGAEWVRLQMSLYSFYECAMAWTYIVVQHFSFAALPLMIEASWAQNPGWPMVGQAIGEACSKYLHIMTFEHILHNYSKLEVQNQRMEVLKKTMAVVWENSSDTIVVGAADGYGFTYMVSPTFWTLVTDRSEHSKALVLTETACGYRTSFCLDWNGGDGFVSNDSTPERVPKHAKASVDSLFNVLKLCREHKEGSCFVHALALADKTTKKAELSDPGDQKSPMTTQCEATVSKLKSQTILVTLRDISDRVKRFEVEKKLAVESTEREKDAQTTRFTRHEVKNGLLAAMGHCDALKDSKQDFSTSEPLSTSSQVILELESTLNEVLDTVLSEAMSRDVIHEVYEPREEEVDIRKLLLSTRHEGSRFPVLSKPDDLPHFLIDPQLFRYIYRNAISNACKYGLLGGKVTTEMVYHEAARVISINVINEAGKHHEELVALGDVASKRVFQQGERLHGRFSSAKDNREVSVSSGDGAWIMKKCALMLGGDVHIIFNPGRTIFNLSIPARPIVHKASQESESTDFEMPSNTLGIAIDDSKVQRKLLDRLMAMVGIEAQNRWVLGETAEEVLSFNDTAKNIIERAPNDARILIIADENLDIVDSNTHHRTISGSVCIEQLRQELHPKVESRVLAVVRSANDSKQDIDTYLLRSHGFLPKAPIRKENVNKLIRPLWLSRFPESEQVVSELPEEDVRSIKRSLSQHSYATGSTTLEDSSSSLQPARTGVITTGADLSVLVEEVDRKIADSTNLEESWRSIRETLVVLKGDMMTMVNVVNPRVSAVVDALDDLRDVKEVPLDFEKRWKLIRALTMSLI